MAVSMKLRVILWVSLESGSYYLGSIFGPLVFAAITGPSGGETHLVPEGATTSFLGGYPLLEYQVTLKRGYGACTF